MHDPWLYTPGIQSMHSKPNNGKVVFRFRMCMSSLRILPIQAQDPPFSFPIVSCSFCSSISFSIPQNLTIHWHNLDSSSHRQLLSSWHSQIPRPHQSSLYCCTPCTRPPSGWRPRVLDLRSQVTDPESVGTLCRSAWF